jgi:DNA-binding beta-propeller fold protein YncE
MAVAVFGYIYRMMRDVIVDKLFRKKIYLARQILLCFFIYSTCALAGKRYDNRCVSSGDDTTRVYKRALIPVHFKLEESGYVTLVIEDISGVRVRNLVSETWYPAGDNIAWWDGTDDLGRDADAASHGIYSVPSNFVNPGRYRIRGLFRNAISAHYEFSFNYAGSPPWSTNDHTGAWLANHTPPQAALYLPGKLSPNHNPLMFLGCYISEGQDGFAWVDLNGKKLGGAGWIGGAWTVAPFIAADNGINVLSENSAYVAAVWETAKLSGQFELRLNALKAYKNDFSVHEIGKFPIGAFSRSDLLAADVLSGLAIYNNQAVVSLIKKDQLLFIDIKKGSVTDSVHIEKPKGIMIDSTGSVFLFSANKLIRFNSIDDIHNGGKPEVIVASGLEDPFGVVEDHRGNIYVTDRGSSSTVKVFNAKGKFVKNIGTPGASKPGSYDPLHMNSPAGLAIDEKQQLWVTEEDFLPKRVSVWSLDGELLKAFYGPSKYGGGGTIDPVDKNKVYYADENRGTMEIALDWPKGTWKLSNIIYRPGKDNLELATRSNAPETPIYFNGHRYFTNCYNSNPTGGAGTAFLFVDRDGIAVPAAAMGNAADWDILKQEQFKKNLPAGINLQVNNQSNSAFFIWQDTNADGQVGPDEVVFQKGASFGVTIMPDLSFCVASFNGNAVRFRPSSFAEKVIPQYNFNNSEMLAANVLPPASSGGAQVITSANGWNVITLGVKPFSAFSLSGAKDGKAMWSYPDLWPGLHASHQAPVADRAGMLIGTTRLLGGMINFKDSKVPSLWAINGNNGNVYLLTEDGLFVATLFKDKSTGANWRMPTAQRNMQLDSLTLGEENFWPTITKTSDEKVYLVDGTRSSIVRLDGLESIRRLPDSFIEVTVADLQKSRMAALKKAAGEQNQLQPKVLNISLSQAKHVIDGNLDEWNTLPWMQIDNRGFTVKRTNLPVYDVSASLCVSGDRLYGMYCAGEPALLQNSGEMPLALFKTGGALDVMIGTSAKANPNRSEPVAGDCRLLITIVNNKPVALLYRAVVAGTKAVDKVPFSSPSNTITFDRVDDVSKYLEFATKNGNYEFSIPLNAVGLKPVDGMQIKGDVGILRGKDGQTVSRMYWSNKSTGITSDVPSEAMLTPNFWGTFVFKK